MAREKGCVVEAIKQGVQAIAPGLSLQKIGHDIAAEAERQAVQTAAELGSVLFTGQAYVPYGSGQAVDLDGKQPLADIMAAGKVVEEAREQKREQGLER